MEIDNGLQGFNDQRHEADMDTVSASLHQMLDTRDDRTPATFTSKLSTLSAISVLG
jgi:hypothetical protein